MLLSVTFDEIFKSKFLESVTSFSLADMLIAMGASFVLSLFIFLIYKKTFCGVMYSASFGISLMAMSMITTLVILAVTSNVVLSLGMVGALSIVRFRTAVKDPLDIVFIFWAITVGIVLGAGLIPHAVIGSLIIGVVLLVIANYKSTDTPYIVIVNCVGGSEVEKAVLEVLHAKAKRSLIKAKTVTVDHIELTVEIRLTEMTASVVNDLAALDGVSNAVLVSYNGDYMA